MASGVKREALHLEGPTIGYAAMMELAKKVSVVTPFVIWPIMAIVAALLRQFWPDNMYALAFLSFVTVFFAGFVWYLTHDRKGLASEHAALTVVAYGTLLCLIDAMGWTRFTIFAMIFGVGFICATWSVRNAIRHHDNTIGGNLSELFETAGLEGTKMHVKPVPGENRKRMSLPWSGRAKTIQGEVITDAPKAGKQRSAPVTRKREARVLLKPGQTVDDLQRKLGSIESAAKVPPGTLQVIKNEDRADVGDMVISDPRTIKKPVLYPGPSWVGAWMDGQPTIGPAASIADTLSVGMYQDGTEVEFDILGLQIQIMGMIGSGKSLGAGWSALAEIITRYDAIVWAVDITKGQQTLGPLSSALHELATEPADAMALLNAANALIKPRTNYLASKGMTKWQKGCGLPYLVVWMEEVPEIVEALQVHERGEVSGEDLWIKSVKAARSAGISFVWSLQRADAEQVPIVSRSQAAKWCFGVADALEATFGLSKVQDNAGCEPENWGNREEHRGKFFLDAPSIPSAKIPMAARAWYWGPDTALISAHAAKYPASARPYDDMMIQALAEARKSIPSTRVPDTSTHYGNKQADDNERDDVEAEEVIPDSELDKEIAELDNDFELTRVEPLPPVAARSIMRNWLVARAGQTVNNADLTEVRNSTGYGRQWGYKVMAEFQTLGLVERHESDDGVSWSVTADADKLSQEG